MTNVRPPQPDEHQATEALRSATAQRHASRGFPIASLFLLVTVCGALIALSIPLVQAVRQEKIPLYDVVISALLAMASSGILGAFVGMFQRRPLLGLCLGAPLGAALGLLLGPLSLLSSEHFGELLRISLFGSVALVVLAIAMRRI